MIVPSCNDPGESASDRGFLAGLDRGVLFAALGVVSVAPAFFGCHPPWAGGFLCAALAALAAAHIAAAAVARRDWLPVSFGLKAAIFLLLGWLLVGASFDWFWGPGAGRIPAISVRKLPFAGAYAAAAILGMGYCSSPGRLRTALRAAAVVGLVMASLALAERLAWDVKSVGGEGRIADRPCGLYINPNRFAVFMAVCWTCAFGAFLEGLADRFDSRLSRLAWAALLMASLLATGSCIGLSLSRLTVGSMGAVLALLALLAAARKLRDGRWEGISAESSPLEKVRLAAVVLIPVAAMAAWGAWCLMVGTSALRNRFAGLLADEASVGSRVAAIRAGWPLAAVEPVFGHGLGSFESAFTAVQPADMPGRWREVHCDWLQLAIEAGLPALAFAVLALSLWALACWRLARGIPGSAAGPRPWLVALPGAGVLVAMACSVLDFPLREPATAAWVFFLAGGVVGVREGDGVGAAPRGAPPASRAMAAAGIAAIGLLLGGAFVAARGGLAYAASPWMGRITCPPVEAGQLSGWERAARIDPGDPELRFRLASSALARQDERPELVPFAREEVRAAAALQPRDYRLPALEAGIAERLGDALGAEALWDRAAGLAPNHVWVRLQFGWFSLRRAAARPEMDGGPRAEDVANAIRSFRIVVAGEAQRGAEVVRALEGAGCAASEIAQLWPGDGDGPRLSRARFYLDRDMPDEAEPELPGDVPGRPLDACWYHALRGRLALFREDVDAGAGHWKEALRILHDAPDRGAEAWLAAASRGVGANATDVLAKRLIEELPACPDLARVFSERLVGARKWLAADVLLERVAHRSPELGAMWAELALTLNDLPSAEYRARAVRERTLSSSAWASWYDRFLARLEERRGEARRKAGTP